MMGVEYFHRSEIETRHPGACHEAGIIQVGLSFPAREVTFPRKRFFIRREGSIYIAQGDESSGSVGMRLCFVEVISQGEILVQQA